MSKASMDIWVLVFTENGLVENVETFLYEQEAREYYTKTKGKDADLDKDEDTELWICLLQYKTGELD